MALGTIDAAVLAEIANAIRRQNGTGTTYRPGGMASAVRALDGSKGDGCVELPEQHGTGVVPEEVFSDLADAIREQTGERSRTYAPASMASAIAGLSWDVGLKLRAHLLSDGTLEVNYLDRATAASGRGSIVRTFHPAPGGYPKEGDVPWSGSPDDVRRVWLDESLERAGITDVSHWFSGLASLEDVSGLEHLTGVRRADRLFSGCGKLQSVWAPGFDASGIESCSGAFYGCRYLVGGHLAVARDTMGVEGFSTGSGGLLADPADDQRRWANSWLYEDGLLVVTRKGDQDPRHGKTKCTGSVCVNARHEAIGSLPWHEGRDSIRAVTFARDMREAGAVCLDHWFHNCKTGHIEFEGWENLDVRSMAHCFNGCLNLRLVDLCGLDPSRIDDLSYAFGGMRSVEWIVVDPTWELGDPAPKGFQTFYGCKSLSGGFGTKFDPSRASGAMAVLDREGQPGYLTAG